MSNNRFKSKKVKNRKEEKKRKTDIPVLYESGNAVGNSFRNSPIKRVHKNRKF